GSLRLVCAADSAAELEFWRSESVAAESLSCQELRRYEPAVQAEPMHVVRLSEQCQIRNPRHLKALIAACRKAGVEFYEGTPVTGWDVEHERVVAARTATGKIAAGQFVIAAGAWSKTLLESAGCPLPVEPVRGQIALLKSRAGLFQHIVEQGTRYLVPRDDGRVVVGSTEERVGYIKANTAQGIQGLLEFASQVVPTLADAELERCWSGLRPGLGTALPVIGAVPPMENLYVAAGHLRSGLQNSPGTAILLRERLLGQSSSIDLLPFNPADRVPVHVASRA
ncbi:MAG: FAD-dependent oxidoreductase, partial [Planctomycetaceae bacterium]